MHDDFARVFARVRFGEVTPWVFIAELRHPLVCNEREAHTVHTPVAALADSQRAAGLPGSLRLELQASFDGARPAMPDLA